MITNKARDLARILWNYQRLNAAIEPAEVIIAMGCEDGRVAERAARLYKDGFAQWVVCTGRSGGRTKAILQAKGFQTEAAYFADTVQKAGVPSERILKEDKATNSGENIAYTKELLIKKGIEAKRIIVVTVPYAERRQQATYAERWPEQSIIVTSPQLTFEAYQTEELAEDYLINALVGRVQRMKVYSERGYQAKTDIPEDVWNACQRLIDMGYTEQLAL
ncbi:MAG TPA: YdcF family protein [Magnetospirillaceae bacterium]|nr:YdcF family protein [Magnetospirillaceae bacterium]